MDMILALGVTLENLAFIIASVVVAAVGGGAHVFNVRTDFSKAPDDADKPKSLGHACANTAWIIARMALAAMTGLVLGMYLAPIASSGDEVLRLLPLVAVAGYSAPKLWAKQGKVLEDLIIGRDRN